MRHKLGCFQKSIHRRGQLHLGVSDGLPKTFWGDRNSGGQFANRILNRPSPFPFHNFPGSSGAKSRTVQTARSAIHPPRRHLQPPPALAGRATSASSGKIMRMRPHSTDAARCGRVPAPLPAACAPHWVGAHSSVQVLPNRVRTRKLRLRCTLLVHLRPPVRTDGATMTNQHPARSADSANCECSRLSSRNRFRFLIPHEAQTRSVYRRTEYSRYGACSPCALVAPLHRIPVRFAVPVQ